MLHYFAPTTVQFTVIAILQALVVLATIKIMNRYHEKQLYLRGDAPLVQKIAELRADLRRSQKQIERLEEKNADLKAQIKGGLQLCGQINSVLTRAGEVEE